MSQWGYGRTATAITSDFRQENVGASYDFGPIKLMGFYDVHRYAGSRQKSWLIGIAKNLGNGVLRTSYVANKRSGGPPGSGHADGDASRQLAVGYVYGLSKRTVLYGTVSRIVNRGGSRLVVTGQPAPAAMRNGEKSSGAELGLAHAF